MGHGGLRWRPAAGGSPWQDRRRSARRAWRDPQGEGPCLLASPSRVSGSFGMLEPGSGPAGRSPPSRVRAMACDPEGDTAFQAALFSRSPGRGTARRIAAEHVACPPSGCGAAVSAASATSLVPANGPENLEKTRRLRSVRHRDSAFQALILRLCSVGLGRVERAAFRARATGLTRRQDYP